MRNAFLVTLTISVIAMAGCKTTTKLAPATTADYELFNVERTNCKTTGVGNPDKLKPVVCITFFSGGASVDPVIVPAAQKLGGTRNKIKFISRGLDQYDIRFETTKCVPIKEKRCKEECDFEVDDTAPVRTMCKYSVVFSRIVDGNIVPITLDPIVIIDTE